VPLDQGTAEAFYGPSTAPDSTAERLFELRWAKSVIAGALNSLREELQAEGKIKLFEQLKGFLTGGCVCDPVSACWTSVAAGVDWPVMPPATLVARWST
jgi:hypothetical protein